jgi:hypothetical protein
MLFIKRIALAAGAWIRNNSCICIIERRWRAVEEWTGGVGD